MTPRGERAEQRQGISLVGATFFAVRVPDVGAAADWYAATLGLETVNTIEADDGSYAIRILGGGGLVIELIEQQGAATPPDRHLGLFKVGFWVDDIDSAFAWLRDREVDTDDAIFVDDALEARSFVFRDPFGNRLQIFEQSRED